MDQLMKKDDNTSGASMLLYVVAGAFLILAIAGVVVSLPDIMRYLRISSM
jgi:hypothetical protein